MRNALGRRLFSAALLCLWLALLLPAAALAIDPMDGDRLCSLTLRYAYQGTAIRNAGFTLYRVADSDEFSDFTFSGAFAGYAYLNVHDYTQSQWNELAVQLAAFVADTGVTGGRFVGATDEDGVLAFSGLPGGLYLLLGEKTPQGDKFFTAAPTLVALPDRDDADQWVYEHTLSPKPGVTDRPITRLTVIKSWKDNNDAADKRPRSIIVDLMHGGQAVDYVVLSRENGWKHTWEELEGAPHEWTAVERGNIPDYRESSQTRIEADGSVVVITNTYNKPHTHTKLPQTGLPWRPVWALAGGGMLLFFLGWLRRRSSEDE